MKTAFVRLALAALAIGTAPAAYAGDTEDFAACDGLKKPKRSDDGMRGVASIEGYNQFSNVFGPPARKSTRKVAACDFALKHDRLLPTHELRRAHLLRARAAAQIDLRNYDLALADLDQAIALVEPKRSDPFFARSMGVSLDMMRAVATAGMGESEAAARIADAAAAHRPYAVQVQTAAHVMRQAASTHGDQAAFDHQLLKLEPKSAYQIVLAEYKAGNFARVSEMARGIPMPLGQAEAGSTTEVASRLKVDNNLITALAMRLAVAYSDAATGDPASARAHIAAVRTRLGMDDEAQAAAGSSPAVTKMLADKVATPLIALAEARLLLADEGPAAALDSVTGVKLPVSAATSDLFAAMRDKAQGIEGLVIPEIAAAPIEKKSPDWILGRLGDLADSLLIAPETERKLIDYKKSRPNILGALVGGAFSLGTSLLGGIDRLSGFRSTPQDDGSVKVEYVGNTTSGPVVQEMTLLRAAELAREADKPGFVIEERRDYQRYMAMTQYGIERSRTLSGYKTELTIRLVDSLDSASAAFDAVQVIDDLGPLYYGE